MEKYFDSEIISRLMTHPTWDILAILFFLAFGFFYGISLGKMRLIAFLFSIYVSGLVFENLSYLDTFIKGRPIFEVFLFRAGIFAILIILLTILFNRVVKEGGLSGGRDWWQVFILSFLETGLLMSFIFQLLPAKELFTFSPVVENIFASDRAFFWWLTLPLVSLFFLIKRRWY